MSRKVVVQVRLPAVLVERLDKLTEEGFYGNRTEAIADGIRHLLERYRRGGRVGRLVRLYLMARVEKTVSIGEIETVENPEEARKAMMNLYGTDDIDEVLSIMRGRR
ncbi:MAG: ribbon-helix-helix domain-containing protein [Candidatus Bathyarchaeia archaeon]